MYDGSLIDFGHMTEEPIGFLPTYKLDKSYEYIWHKNPSYTDWVFYAFSRNGQKKIEVKSLEYNSFKIDGLNSDHYGVR